MKQRLLGLIVVLFAINAQAQQFSLRRSVNAQNQPILNQVDVLFKTPPGFTGTQAPSYFQFAVQIPLLQGAANILGDFVPLAPLASIAAFGSTTGIDGLNKTYTFASSGNPNYNNTYNFGAAGTEHVIGRIVFTAINNEQLGDEVVNAIDYTSVPVPNGGITLNGFWTLSFVNPITTTEVSDPNALFYQNPGSTAPSTSFEYATANQTVAIINSTPLSLELIAFDAAKSGNMRARLDWKTLNEKNTDYFIIERSMNGRNFGTEVARIKAAGNSEELLNYLAYDEAPMVGDNYYRLKTVNRDGSNGYSPIRKLNFSFTGSDVTAVPNPFQAATNIHIFADREQQANYLITDGIGRTIRTGVWQLKAGAQEIPLDLNDIAAGTYLLSVRGGSVLAEIKLVKTN